MKRETINDASYAFVNEFKAFPYGMIKKLIFADPDELRDVDSEDNPYF